MMAASTDRKQLGELNRELAGARDTQIARVVAMVDALPERGAADSLISPLRSRLAQLHPARPLRFCRLLFIPFDPIIVPGPNWRPGSPSLPRSVLEPIAGYVRAELGPAAAGIESYIAGRTTADTAIVARAGAVLWPVAARILARSAAPPPRWAETGLPDALHGALAHAIGAVLAQATDLHELVEAVTHGAKLLPEAVLRILDTSAGHSPDAWGMKLALLLSRLPQADAVLRVAIAGGLIGPNTVMRTAAEQAVDVVLDGLVAQGGDAGPVGDSELAEAGKEVIRLQALLQGLDSDQMGTERRRRVQELRRCVEASCAARFEAGLEGELVAPLRLLRSGGDPAEVSRLEGIARDLCRLEAAARKLNARSGLGARLLRTADEICAMQPGGILGLADRVRLVEILAGPDAALAMLDAGA